MLVLNSISSTQSNVLVYREDQRGNSLIKFVFTILVVIGKLKTTIYKTINKVNDLAGIRLYTE